MKRRVSFKQMVPSGYMIVIVGAVHSTAEKHPISLFPCNEEYGVRGIENMRAYERGNLTLI